MTALLPRLQSLVKGLERDDLTTVEALLMDMTGNRVAAQMLERLFLWWPKATNPEGWVYKSHDEWWAELRVKENEMTKARGALEMVGVVIQRKQAAVKSDKTISGWAAAPVRHYRLDIRRFLKRLANTLALSIKNMCSLLKKPFAERSKIVLSNGQKTITTSLQTNLQTDVVVKQQAIKAVKDLEVKADRARQLVDHYGANRVIDLALAAKQRASKNPAGWLIRALEEDWSLASVDSPTPVAPAPSPADPAKWEEADDDTKPDYEADEEETVSSGDTQPVVVPPVQGCQTPWESNWERAYSQLEIQLDRASFDTWVRAAHFIRFEDGVYVIGVPNDYARAMCQHRIYRDIRRVLGNVTGGKAELQFEVVKPPAHQEEELPLFKLLARQGA